MADEPTVFAFGGFEVDEALQELRREGRPVELHATPLRLLLYLLRNRDRVVPKQELLDQVWPEAIVSESALFSALKEIRLALGDTGAEQRTVETLRGRGYRLIAPVEERPALAPAPEGGPATATPAAGETAPMQRELRHALRGGWIATLLVGAVVIAALLWWWSATTPPATPPRSVAVLPFTDLSPEGDQEYFADGMTEELINCLSQIEELRVVARTSAFAFQGRNVDVREIGEQLNVGALVEGSVRKTSGRVRITAQLVSVDDGYHLWSQAYDRHLAEVFEAQQEIARSVAEALQVELLGGDVRLAAPPTRDEAAYEFYLMGRYFFSRFTEESLRRAASYLERAVAADPDYALAHAGLADAYFGLWDSFADRRPQVLEQASAAARRALSIAPELPEAHAALGMISVGRWDWAGAEREYQRALELNPGLATAHMRRAALFAQLGRLDEALAAAERGRALDPLSPIKNSITGQLYYYARDHERAMEWLGRASELGGENGEWDFFLMLTYLDAGRDEDALRLLLHGMPPDLQRAVRRSFEQGGSRAAVSTWLDAVIAASGRPCTEFANSAALAFAYLGEADRMFSCLEEVTETRTGGFFLKVEPLYQPYRSDPRFVAILERWGLADPR